MMGFDDILVGFALSYAAGNTPQIKEWLQGKKGLQDKISKCYDRALKKWTVNDQIRSTEKIHESIRLDELKQVLEGKDIKKSGYAELVQLWIDELRNDADCYYFILEHKTDILAVKLDEGFARLAAILKEDVNELHDFRQESNAQHKQIMSMLQKIESNQNGITEGELFEMIRQLLDGVTSQMIETLRLDSASELLDEIDKAFHDVIIKNTNLYASFLKAKGDSISLKESKQSCDLYHQAYLMKPDDNGLKELEMIMLRKKNSKEALRLAKQLPDSNIKRRSLEIYFSDNPEDVYRQLPNDIKESYTLRYYLLVFLGEKGIDTSFLFEDETLKLESSLTFNNMFAWLYIMTWHSVKVGGELRLSNLQPISPEMKPAYETSKLLMGMLQRTEVRPVFAMAEAHYCYWGFILDGNYSWVDSIHQISRPADKEQRILLNMFEVSMLVISQRFDDAFQMIATMREDITKEISDFVILMGFHSNNMKMIGWVMELVKEKPFKLNSSAALHIAFCVNRSTASEILGYIDDDQFENTNDAVVLKELCKSYDDREVDVETLKDHLEGLSDDMLAYAAQVLSNSGEAPMAYDLLQPKIDSHRNDLRQRVFMDIMAKLPEKQSELRSIIIEKRKVGEIIDDELLGLEFTMDCRVGDYQNAFETVSILYGRRPTDETIFVNYLKMLGRFDTKELEKKRDEVLGFKFNQFVNVQQTYQIFIENKYDETAVEVLYKYVNDSHNTEVRTFYYLESLSGQISSLVNQYYPIAKDGLYGICDRADGERLFFKVETGTEVGEKLLGMKEGESFILMEEGIESSYALTHIVNKYGKLCAEISLEIAKGENPNFKVLHIDMSNPLDSLQEQLALLNPDSVNYRKNKQLAEEKYEKEEIGILSFVSDDDIIGDYYSRLFSSSIVYVAPYQVLDGICFQGGMPNKIRYVLDITGLFVLFEFHQKSGCQYGDKFLIPSTTYEFVLAAFKNSGKMAVHSYSEALRNGTIVKYKDYIDLDFEIRMSKLLKWMDDNCEKVVSDKFLSIDLKDQNSITKVLTLNTLTLMMEQGRCLISDDQIIEKTLRTKARVITTETYMRRKGGEETTSFIDFLVSCNYIGVFLSSDFIYNEYMKMERGQENKFTYITQNAAKNEILTTIIIKAAIKIAADAKDKKLATISLTNLMAIMIKAINWQYKSYMVTNLLNSLPVEYVNTMMVRQCLNDAARINNVVILPSYYNM